MAIRKIFDGLMHYPSQEEINGAPAVSVCQPENKSKFSRGNEDGKTDLAVARKLARTIWSSTTSE